jgi:hypothetical protein
MGREARDDVVLRAFHDDLDDLGGDAEVVTAPDRHD